MNALHRKKWPAAHLTSGKVSWKRSIIFGLKHMQELANRLIAKTLGDRFHRIYLASKVGLTIRMVFMQRPCFSSCQEESTGIQDFLSASVVHQAKVNEYKQKSGLGLFIVLTKNKRFHRRMEKSFQSVCCVAPRSCFALYLTAHIMISYF